MAEFDDLKIYNLDELESRINQAEIHWLVRESENNFLRMANDVAAKAAWNPNIKAIFISGPSSSGKTTFSNRLAGALHMYGRSTTVLHLDNYYKEKRTETDEQGRPDFESASTLSMDLIVDDIKKILAYERVNFPEYDFVTRKRIYKPENVLTMNPRGILLVEGLHALSGEIEREIPPENCLRVFIMPRATLNIDRNNSLDSRDIRMLRRISRDYFSRSSNPFSSIDYWPMLDKSEAAVFPGYLARADIFINSLMPYEFFVIAPLASDLIAKELADYERGILSPSVYLSNGKMYADFAMTLAKAASLVEVCQCIPKIEPAIVPEISILNEFLGK